MPQDDDPIFVLPTLGRLLQRVKTVSVGTSGISATFDLERKQATRAAIRALLVFLEDRRVLYAVDYRDFYNEMQYRHHERVPHVVASVLEIRQKINETLSQVEYDPDIEELLLVMQEACRKLLDAKRDTNPEVTPLYETALGQIRLIFGLAVGGLSNVYDLPLKKNLKHLSDLSRQVNLK